MAALLTVLSILIGIALGYANGGSFEKAQRCRPVAWQLGVFGLILQIVLVGGLVSGGWATLVELVSSVSLLGFTIANRRIGGMVAVVCGLTLNLIPTLVNWGMPTSRAALESAGIVTKDQLGPLVLRGARHVATSDDWLRFLGEVIALPTRQVISIGDIFLYIGFALTTASVLRGRTLLRGTTHTYRQRIAPLGMGPAKRRGPGLHPSRLGPAMKHPSVVDRDP